MCGICGIIRLDKRRVSEAQVRRMMKLMKHRGPDDEGVFIRGNVALGCVRLKILDLSRAAHMPMTSQDQRYVIIHNGEVLNYVELREELGSHFKFRSNSDTEVIFKSYMHWGSKCLERFNGMFAFVIYDTVQKTFFIARDRFGIKPFYYYTDNNVLIFASEIPPILAALNRKPEPDQAMIYDFLVFNRTNHTAHTFFKDIKKLPHGYSLEIKDQKISLHRWYRLADKLHKPFHSPQDLRRRLEDSMNLYVRSDVPVGACFSGGIDSSTLVSMMLKLNPDLHTFSAVYQRGSRADETPFIRYYRPYVKNMHLIRPTADYFWDDLTDFVRSQAEPLPGTSAYAEYKVMERAREHVKVVLVGQGVDEAMAGYHYFFGFYFKELLAKFSLFTLLKEMFCYVKNHHSGYGIESMFYLLLPPAIKSRVMSLERPYYQPDFIRQYRDASAVTQTLHGSSTLHQALLDHFEYKFEHHLLWGDRSAMHFSIEARFPFLDHNLVEGMLSLENRDIIRNGTTKYLLREAVRGLVPSPIRVRKDKVGYATLEDEWMRSERFKKLILSILNSEQVLHRGYIEQKKALQMYKEHLSGKKNNGAEIWKWLNLELWFREFIDKY